MGWSVKIANKNGEEAHQAGFTAYFPPLVKLNSFRMTHKGKEVSQPEKDQFSCNEQVTVKYNKISCSVGNPYLPNTESEVKLVLDIIYVRDSHGPTFEFRIDTWTHKRQHSKDQALQRSTRGPEVWGKGGSHDANAENSKVYNLGNFYFQTELKLVSETRPEFIPIKYSPYSRNEKRQTEKIADFGDELSSVLIVENVGETPAHNLEVKIVIPYKLKASKNNWLLYPMDSVVIKDVELKSRCFIKGGFNPQKFDFVNDGSKLIPQIQRRSAGDSEEDD